MRKAGGSDKEAGDKSGEMGEATMLLAIAGHELRTPVGAVLTLVELLQSTDLDDRQRYILSSIQEAAQIGLTLAEDILQAGRAAQGRAPVVREPYAPSRVIDEAVSILTPAAEQKNLSLGVDSDRVAGRWVSGDGGAVRRILFSLLENAVKYTDRGRVAVSSALEADATVAGGQMLVLSVQDAGPGLREEDRERLFEAFSRGSGVAGIAGSGLGLWIVQTLVRSLQGTVTVEGERGKGTTFVVRLPAPPAEAPAELVDEDADDPVPIQTDEPARILVVDDNRFSREIAVACLSGFGMESVAVASGERALSFLSKTERDVDLVLLDLTMPGLDGYETARRIHAITTEKLPILAMSAWTGDVDTDKVDAANFAGRIDKPFKPHDLYKAIRAALRPAQTS